MKSETSQTGVTNSQRLIKSEFLRNEGYYTVNVKVNDLHSNYIYESSVNFVPTLCQWFEVIEDQKHINKIEKEDLIEE
jgi:hypothetical protein